MAVMDQEKRQHHNVVAVLKAESREPKHYPDQQQCAERERKIEPIETAKAAHTGTCQPLHKRGVDRTALLA